MADGVRSSATAEGGRSAGSFTFTIVAGISCTFFAFQLFMLPVVIFKRTTPRLTVKIQLDMETNSFYKVVLANP